MVVCDSITTPALRVFFIFERWLCRHTSCVLFKLKTVTKYPHFFKISSRENFSNRLFQFFCKATTFQGNIPLVPVSVFGKWIRNTSCLFYVLDKVWCFEIEFESRTVSAFQSEPNGDFVEEAYVNDHIMSISTFFDKLSSSESTVNLDFLEGGCNWSMGYKSTFWIDFPLLEWKPELDFVERACYDQ